MRTIVHLSDIHFGTTDAAVVERLVEKTNEIEPHLVVVSGDLTQRAKSDEFRQAREFLDRLPFPQIVVPGNHDVPLYNVYHRFFRRLDKFKENITQDLRPTFIDDEIAVVGINTARSLTIKGGRISPEQVDFIKDTMSGLRPEILKIIVTHHPFDLPEGFGEDDLLGRAEKAMESISQCGGNVFLAGHLHVSNIETTAKRYKLANGRNALVIQAGTAASARVRGEAHSFNIIRFDRPQLKVERYECTDPVDGFAPAEEKVYRLSETGWKRL